MWTASSTKESSASTCVFQSGYIEKIDVSGRWQCVLGGANEKKRERNAHVSDGRVGGCGFPMVTTWSDV